MIATLSHQTV